MNVKMKLWMKIKKYVWILLSLLGLFGSFAAGHLVTYYNWQHFYVEAVSDMVIAPDSPAEWIALLDEHKGAQLDFAAIDIDGEHGYLIEDFKNWATEQFYTWQIGGGILWGSTLFIYVHGFTDEGETEDWNLVFSLNGAGRMVLVSAEQLDW